MSEPIYKGKFETDKMAAELALVKLKPEALKLEEELEQMNSTASKAIAAPGRHRAFAVVIAFVGGLVMIGGYMASGLVAGLIGFLVLCIGILFVFDPKTKSMSSYSQAAEKQVRQKALQIEEVNEQIADQYHIVNSGEHQAR